jgi:hypothetical protein
MAVFVGHVMHLGRALTKSLRRLFEQPKSDLMSFHSELLKKAITRRAIDLYKENLQHCLHLFRPSPWNSFLSGLFLQTYWVHQ